MPVPTAQIKEALAEAQRMIDAFEGAYAERQRQIDAALTVEKQAVREALDRVRRVLAETGDTASAAAAVPQQPAAPIMRTTL